MFSNIFERFRTFSNVFERFFLAWFAQTLQFNLPNPVFTSKTNIPSKNNLKKPHFSKIPDNFSPQFYQSLRKRFLRKLLSAVAPVLRSLGEVGLRRWMCI